MPIATATESILTGPRDVTKYELRGSVKRPINAVQPTHPKTAHVVDLEGEAAEAENDTK